MYPSRERRFFYEYYVTTVFPSRYFGCPFDWSVMDENNYRSTAVNNNILDFTNSHA